MTIDIATLQLPTDKKVELPILQPTLGFNAVDIHTLGKESYYTFDPGFMATAACKSKITYIDGELGILEYRGYPIEQLAADAKYSEVIYLLLYGELPTAQQKLDLEKSLKENATVPDKLHKLLAAFPQDAHPMSMLMSLMSALDAFYGRDINIENADDRNKIVIQLIAKIPTLAAMCHRHAIGEEFVAPNAQLDYAANFLYMLTGTIPGDINANAMDVIFTLHADHEQNASTSTVRMAGSTGTSPFAAIGAGIAALWGPTHGGANEATLNMLRDIKTIDRIPQFLARAKDKNDPFKLMGFGHRVYKNRDPRGLIIRDMCYQVLGSDSKHADNPLFKLALELEKIALQDPYFVTRKLYPNIEFYSGIIQTALGIPSTMFTVVFSLARTTGWAAQWNEMISDPDYKIARPRQLYMGYAKRDFVALEKR
ncbi:MAG: citrate synthase [Gammaproteobacteria bacterium]|nr:citrate synthase [Gammaproteobacteria bacterium]